MSPTIIALHYWAGSGREYDLLRPLLPAARILTPDLPGFGSASVPPGFDYSVCAYTDWLSAYIQQQQATDYTLVGHSMSGKLALALAARQPPGLQRLVLLAPSPPAGEPMSDDDRAAALAAYGKPEEAEKTFRKITQKPLAAAQRQQVITDNLRSTEAAWTAWLLRGAREDIRFLMPQLHVPCHLLVGAGDAAVTPATQPQLTLPLLPAGSVFTRVPGAGHLLPLEAPGEVQQALQSPK